jgi:predicted hotdog family 3-hydroxylacyl-ACP dehydratase
VVLVELIAQSVGVQMGWQRRHVERMGGRGLLVGVRRASFGAARVASGTVLRTTVRGVRSVESFVVFTGAVSDGRRTLCEAEIQAFRPEGTEAGR